eukprot:s3556_g16.t3
MDATEVATLLRFCRVTVLSVVQRNRGRTLLSRCWNFLRLFVTQLWSLREALEDLLETVNFDRRLLCDIAPARRTTLAISRHCSAGRIGDFSPGSQRPIFYNIQTFFIFLLHFVMLLYTRARTLYLLNREVWETGTPHPLSLDFRDRPSPGRLLQVLYPGREHPGVYTPVEQLYLAQTTFRWLFDNFLLNVPLSLPPQSLANFFIYVTLPVAMFNVKLQSLLSGQALNFTGQDAFWGNSHLNFSFTPRSALLLFSFGLSIQLRNGVHHPAVGALLTFGFRPTLQYFSHLVSQYAVWNRRYLDYFMAIPANGQVTLTLQTADERAMLQSAIVLLHPTYDDGYFICNGLNALLERADSPWWRLFHLPVPRRLYEQVTQGAVWDQIPRQLWQAMGRTPESETASSMLQSKYPVWIRHDDRLLQAQSCSLLPSDAGHDLPFWLGTGRSSRLHRAAAAASFLETLKAEATHSESGRSRGPPTAFGGFSHPQRQHKMQWDSMPLDVRDSSDDLIIDREDEDYPPEELDNEIGPVVPLFPPKPSAIGDLRGESDGPRPASHLLPLEKDDEAAIPSFAAAPQTEEASGYVKETRLDVLDKWPPPPRQDGDADLPAGPVPSVKLYAEHRYADAEKANQSWSELLRQHEEAKEAATAKPAFEVHLKDDAAEQDQDSSGELYNSPNADNVIPPELRTGLERKHLVLSHFSARYARTSEADQSIPDPAQKLGDEAWSWAGAGNWTEVLRGDHFEPEQELAVKKYPWHRETSVWPTKSGYPFPASSRQLAMGRLLPGHPRAERRALTSLALASVLIGISWTWSATCFGGKKKSKDVPADEKARIISILGREVVDSRGNPTVEAELTTGYGTVRAVVPSGASTGIYEALELRDGGSRYEGQGVSKAVNNINRVIAPKLKGKDVRFQKDLDELMVAARVSWTLRAVLQFMCRYACRSSSWMGRRTSGVIQRPGRIAFWQMWSWRLFG